MTEIKKTKEKTESTRPPNMLKRVLVRNGFYWAQYKTLLALNVFAVCFLCFGVYAFVHFATADPKNKYLPTTSDFRMIMSPPLSEEFLSEGDVTQLATNTVRAMYTYDYVNWPDQIRDVSKFFTTPGFNNFQQALVNSGALAAVQKDNQVVTQHIIEAPFIREKGVVNGSFTWIVDFPKVEVTFKNPPIGNRQSLTFIYAIQMEVIRASLLAAEKGALVSNVRVRDISQSN